MRKIINSDAIDGAISSFVSSLDTGLDYDMIGLSFLCFTGARKLRQYILGKFLLHELTSVTGSCFRHS